MPEPPARISNQTSQYRLFSSKQVPESSASAIDIASVRLTLLYQADGLFSKHATCTTVSAIPSLEVIRNLHVLRIGLLSYWTYQAWVGWQRY